LGVVILSATIPFSSLVTGKEAQLIVKNNINKNERINLFIS